MSKVNIFWFRRDLRLDDNVGLYHCSQSDIPFVPIFIFDPNILKKLSDPKDARVKFIHDTLKVLKTEVQALGSDLRVFYMTPEEAYKKLIQEYDIAGVYTNEDYEPYAIKRDNAVKNLLAKNSIELHLFKDQCIFAKDEILKADGKPYTVFSAYKRKWYEYVTPKHLASYASKKGLKNLVKLKPQKMISLKDLGFEECLVQNDVKSIKRNIVKNYEETRNFPAILGTTQLGMHLRFGTVSVRKCAQVGYHDSHCWLDELIWREFFMQILYHFPYVVDKPFKSKYAGIKWRNDKADFKKWCEGKTGYALVDAGMRELNATGFMHNRVRMVTASFLIKHLLIDWRWGERYFAEKLLDFDLSANNGNWQWVAGSGCDAAPYFRVFNPDLQLKKFDPKLDYVKKWIPEYGTDAYPEKMVEHKMAYNRALLSYKTAIEQAN